MTTNDNEWQQVMQQVITNVNEWYNKWRRMKTNESKWKRVILGSEWNKICNVQLQSIQECKLFINSEIDDIHFQYNILCFYHAHVFHYQFCWNLLKYVKLLTVKGLFIWGETSHRGWTSHLSKVLFIPGLH